MLKRLLILVQLAADALYCPAMAETNLSPRFCARFRSAHATLAFERKVRAEAAALRAVPRIAGSLLMIQEALQAKPVATVATLREATGLTTPTINSLLRELESRGIIKESTGRARDRVYVYRRYLDALAAEEEARVSAAEKALTTPGEL